MSTRSFQRLGVAGLAALTVVGLLSGCAAKKKTASASTAAASTAAAATDTSSKVVATGGGKFCQQVADSVNNNVAKEAATGGSSDSLKTSVQNFKSIEGSVLKSAPGAIKPDLVTLFGALDQFYSALAADNYDFTKIDPSVEAPLETPAVQAAEKNVDDYMKNTCGIDIGGDAASANTGDVEASASAALASALAKLTASAAPA
ncbi:MAG TPA: hypothetical protein VGD55_10020, partial [Acidothermaceae bacterium]